MNFGPLGWLLERAHPRKPITGQLWAGMGGVAVAAGCDRVGIDVGLLILASRARLQAGWEVLAIATVVEGVEL